MNVTVSKIENVTEMQTLSAVSSFGTGFLTALVSGFIELFGVENHMLARKMEKAKDSATAQLVLQAQQIKADGIMNLNYQFSGMSVLAYGTAYAGAKSTAVYDEVPEI